MGIAAQRRGTIAGAVAVLHGTFGTTTIGGSADANPSGYVIVGKYTLSVGPVSVTKLTMYTNTAGGPQVMKAVIYANSAGEPGALLATSPEVALAGALPAAWYDFPFSSGVALAAGTYWLGFHYSNNGNGSARYHDALAGAERYRAFAYASGPPNPYGTADGSQDYNLSTYATY